MIAIQTLKNGIEAVNPHQVEKIFVLDANTCRLNHTDGSYTITPTPFRELEHKFYESMERIECWEQDELINPLNVSKVFMDRNGKTVIRLVKGEPSFSSEDFAAVIGRLSI